MSKDILEEEIRGIVSVITGIPEQKIESDLNFIDDLGIESVMAVGIVNKVEEKYDLDIPADKFGELDSLSSIVQIVHELKAEVA